MIVGPESPLGPRVKMASLAFAALALTGSVSSPCTSNAFEPEQPPIVCRMATSVGENTYYTTRILSQPLSSANLTVNDLRDFSGLTASQIGRLFGVSRRSVNNWMAGNPMAPRHQERLSTIQQTLLSLTGRSAEERRVELLVSSAGPSIFQQLVNQISGDAVLRENPLSAKDQF